MNFPLTHQNKQYLCQIEDEKQFSNTKQFEECCLKMKKELYSILQLKDKSLKRIVRYDDNSKLTYYDEKDKDVRDEPHKPIRFFNFEGHELNSDFKLDLLEQEVHLVLCFDSGEPITLINHEKCKVTKIIIDISLLSNPNWINFLNQFESYRLVINLGERKQNDISKLYPSIFTNYLNNPINLKVVSYAETGLGKGMTPSVGLMFINMEKLEHIGYVNLPETVRLLNWVPYFNDRVNNMIATITSAKVLGGQYFQDRSDNLYFSNLTKLKVTRATPNLNIFSLKITNESKIEELKLYSRDPNSKFNLKRLTGLKKLTTNTNLSIDNRLTFLGLESDKLQIKATPRTVKYKDYYFYF